MSLNDILTLKVEDLHRHTRPAMINIHFVAFANEANTVTIVLLAPSEMIISEVTFLLFALSQVNVTYNGWLCVFLCKCSAHLIRDYDSWFSR